MDKPDDDDCKLAQHTATVLLMCGLPGSGKSSLAKFLCKRNGQHHQWVHLEYDDLARTLQQQHSENNFQDPSGECSFEERIEFSNDDEDNVDDDGDDDDKSWLQAWRESRTQALHLVREELNRHMKKNNSVDANNNTFGYRHLIVMMDDNFFLRSMRRDVYKVCQQVTAASHALNDTNGLDRDAASIISLPKQIIPIYFGIIWMDSSSEVCLQRNRQRIQDQVVSDETIVKMSHRFEPPNPDKYEFEQHCLHVHGDDNLDEPSRNSNLISRVVTFIESCRRSTPVPLPPPPPELDAARLAEGRRKTLESRLHQYDKILRGWVGLVAQMERSAAGAANAARQTLMQRLRREQRPRQRSGDDEEPLQNAIHTPELFEWFWDDMMLSSSPLQDWSQEQKEELRQRVLA